MVPRLHEPLCGPSFIYLLTDLDHPSFRSSQNSFRKERSGFVTYFFSPFSLRIILRIVPGPRGRNLLDRLVIQCEQQRCLREMVSSTPMLRSGLRTLFSMCLCYLGDGTIGSNVTLFHRFGYRFHERTRSSLLCSNIRSVVREEFGRL